MESRNNRFVTFLLAVFLGAGVTYFAYQIFITHFPPKESPKLDLETISREEQSDLVAWRDSHKELLNNLKAIPGFTKDSLLDYFAKNNEILENLGVKNLSSSMNYIFPITIAKNSYIVKIPSAVSRRNNYIVQEGEEAELDQQLLTEEDKQTLFEQFNKEMPNTYQGVSRYYTFKILDDALNAKELEHTDLTLNKNFLEIPEKFLVPYGDHDAQINDDNFFIVEKFIPFKILDEVELKALSLNQLRELINAGWIGLLWNYDKNVGLTENGKLVLFDLEQPDRFNPQDFFRKNLARDQIFAVNGLEYFLILFKDHEHFNEVFDHIKSVYEKELAAGKLHNADYFDAMLRKYEDKKLDTTSE